MKRVITCLALIALSFGLLAASQANAQGKEVDWDSFSKNLCANLASDNHGVKQSAMQLIIKYADKLTINDDAIFNLVRVYRWEKDVKYRQMALVTLYSTKDKWVMDFLKRSLRFEDNPVLKHTIAAIVLDYESNQSGP